MAGNDMPSPATFLLTRNAAQDLRRSTRDHAENGAMTWPTASEHFKSVVTGLIPVDENDEGFSSIRLNVKTDEIYKHFKKLVNDYEVMAVQQLRLFEKNQGS